jgi:flagellar biosynthetic protein FliP
MRRWWVLAVVFILATVAGAEALAQSTQVTLPSVQLSMGGEENPKEFSTAIQIVIVMTVLTLAPSILIMMTCFTRLIVVFHFLKQALGTQTQPPSQVLVGLALFITAFVMGPALEQANTQGLQPYLREEITQEQAVTAMVQPFREFMVKRTRTEDLALFLRMRGGEQPKTIDDVSIFAIIPAFTLSELRVGFQIGFIVFIPFLIVDMVISSILMSLGMMLLPPQLISLPIKILLFILVDGWNLLIGSLVEGIMRAG